MALTVLLVAISIGDAFGQVFNNGNNDEAQRDRTRIAAVAAARGQMDRAQQLINVAQQRVQANWKANPQYLAALNEQADAKKAFGAERDRVLENLRQDNSYRETKQAERDAVVDVHNAQVQTNATQPDAKPGTAKLPDPSADQIAAAQDKLDQKSRVRKLESDAVDADPAAAKTKARLDKADDDLKVLALQLKAALLNDPDYKSALDQLTQAKAQLAAAAGSN